jgi:hypothetical protein
MTACVLVLGCESAHPLANTGAAQFRVSDAPIYAADALAEDGRPILPRQAPFEKNVQLFMTSANAPDHGAYVDVQLSPPNVLLLLSSGDSCELLEGTFRCTAGDDGFANFRVRSESDWSGTAELSLVGREARGERGEIRVNPAGLPEEAANFELIIEGVAGSKVPARYTSLECSLGPVPDTTYEKYPEGLTRVRQAEVRADGPLTAPSVVEHAPVLIDSLDPEVFVSFDDRCTPPGDSRLRVQLDGKGKSPPFFFCFSQLGSSTAQVAIRSGSKRDERLLNVELEPRLLRVVNIQATLTVGQFDVDVATVSAFNTDIEQVSFPVDVRSSDPSVLQVTNPVLLLPLEGQTGLVRVTPLRAGTATIRVTPQLLDSPRCETLTITVQP